MIVTFETAKVAKELGFDKNVTSFYLNGELHSDTNRKGNYNSLKWVRTWRTSNEDDVISAPTQSEFQKWLKKEYDIDMFMLPQMVKKEN